MLPTLTRFLHSESPGENKLVQLKCRSRESSNCPLTHMYMMEGWYYSFASVPCQNVKSKHWTQIYLKVLSSLEEKSDTERS